MSDEKPVLKIITLGDSGVGKTSIFKRYVHNNFDEDNLSTVGIGYYFKDFNLGPKIGYNLKLIDTAGQEKYMSVCKGYFRDVDGVLLIFSLDDKETFDNLNNWLDVFNETVGTNDIPKYLIGNKCDINNEFDTNLIEDFMKKNNIIGYKFTSSKDNHFINEIFEEIVKAINEKSNNKKPKKKKSKIKLENNNNTNKKKKKFC